MSRRTTVAGLLGCALLAAPVGAAGQGPTALPASPAAADAVTATATAPVALPEPVVVPASTGARAWASGTAPTGVAPKRLSDVVLDAYTRAAVLAPERCHLTVPLLAAIGQVESGNMVGRALDAGHRATPAIVGPRLDGGAFRAVADTDRGQLDGDRRFDRALGPLQFLPSTWRSVAVDLDDDGARDPQSIYDAAGGAMVYLCGEGRDLADDADLRDAVLSYNRSQAYLAQVLRWKATFEDADLGRLASLPTFASWAVLAPTGPVGTSAGDRVDVAEAVRPKPAAPAGPTASTRPTGAATPSGPSGPSAPVVPGGTAQVPAAPGAPGAAPGTPVTPATGPKAPADGSGPAPTTATAPTTPTRPTKAAGPGTPVVASPDPAPDPAGDPVPSSTLVTIPALADLLDCVAPTDPALPPPAPVDENTHPLLVPGALEEGTVTLANGLVVAVEQLCLGTPEPPA